MEDFQAFLKSLTQVAHLAYQPFASNMNYQNDMRRLLLQLEQPDSFWRGWKSSQQPIEKSDFADLIGHVDHETQVSFFQVLDAFQLIDLVDWVNKHINTHCDQSRAALEACFRQGLLAHIFFCNADKIFHDYLLLKSMLGLCHELEKPQLSQVSSSYLFEMSDIKTIEMTGKLCKDICELSPVLMELILLRLTSEQIHQLANYVNQFHSREQLCDVLLKSRLLKYKKLVLSILESGEMKQSYLADFRYSFGDMLDKFIPMSLQMEAWEAPCDQQEAFIHVFQKHWEMLSDSLPYHTAVLHSVPLDHESTGPTQQLLLSVAPAHINLIYRLLTHTPDKLFEHPLRIGNS
ncbi:hypothetical protein [Algicola sagamiensis]|uniref:hypothetical protein n=1 Tax=Algicola sagamiensis TaxID=163869 RepID=UPI0003638080|nr:hypothetical protein [Algicola sagamiensis]